MSLIYNLFFFLQKRMFFYHIKVFFPDIDRKWQKKQISAISINFFGLASSFIKTLHLCFPWLPARYHWKWGCLFCSLYSVISWEGNQVIKGQGWNKWRSLSRQKMKRSVNGLAINTSYHLKCPSSKSVLVTQSCLGFLVMILIYYSPAILFLILLDWMTAISSMILLLKWKSLVSLDKKETQND